MALNLRRALAAVYKRRSIDAAVDSWLAGEISWATMYYTVTLYGHDLDRNHPAVLAAHEIAAAELVPLVAA